MFSGTGKTMVMDMFYSYVETEKKKRVHFHGFMLDVHKSESHQCLFQGCKVSEKLGENICCLSFVELIMFKVGIF